MERGNTTVRMKEARKHIVEFSGVNKRLSGRDILNNLTFSVEKGETFVIIGYSGSGKSVTLRHLIGLMRPDAGSIRIFGDEITTMTGKELEAMRAKFGVLFQSGALIAWLTLYENVELPLLEHTSLTKAQRHKVIQQKLELVNLWQDRDKYPAQISGGMKKRGGLARAIAMDPEIVLYDEPTSGLDPVFANEIGKLTNALRDRLGMTQIVVTHDMESAYDIADRIGMFYHGEMIEVGTPEQIRTSSNPEVQHFISGGKRGRISQRSITAIIRGKPPGTQTSHRSTDPVLMERYEETDRDEAAREAPPAEPEAASVAPPPAAPPLEDQSPAVAEPDDAPEEYEYIPVEEDEAAADVQTLVESPEESPQLPQPESPEPEPELSSSRLTGTRMLRPQDFEAPPEDEAASEPERSSEADDPGASATLEPRAGAEIDDSAAGPLFEPESEPEEYEYIPVEEDEVQAAREADPAEPEPDPDEGEVPRVEKKTQTWLPAPEVMQGDAEPSPPQLPVEPDVESEGDFGDYLLLDPEPGDPPELEPEQ